MSIGHAEASIVRVFTDDDEEEEVEDVELCEVDELEERVE